MPGYTPLRSGIATSEKGAAGGVAVLGAGGVLASPIAFGGARSGRYVTGLITAAAATVGTMAEGRIYVLPFYSAVDAKLDRAGMFVSTAVADTAIHLGISEADPTTLLPVTLLADWGTVSAVATGEVTATIDQDIEAGKLYFLLSLAVGGAPTVRGGLALFDFFGQGSALEVLSNAGIRKTVVGATTGNTTLPSSLPAFSVSSSHTPGICVRYV